MIGTPRIQEQKEALEETCPVSEQRDRPSCRAQAVWWLAQLIQHVAYNADEPTLRTTVIPAARHILEGLQ